MSALTEAKQHVDQIAEHLQAANDTGSFAFEQQSLRRAKNLLRVALALVDARLILVDDKVEEDEERNR